MSSVPAVKNRKKKKGNGSTGSSFDNLEIFLLHLPTTLWYLIFCYAPMFGVVIAFKNYKPKPGKSFRMLNFGLIASPLAPLLNMPFSLVMTESPLPSLPAAEIVSIVPTGSAFSILAFPL